MSPAAAAAERLVMEVVPPGRLAAATAAWIAARLSECIATRGAVTLALSGGSTPVPMFADLFARDLPWDRVTIVQVDERVAPGGHPDRNLTDLERQRRNTPASAAVVAPMPVERDDLDDAADDYAAVLRGHAGDPPTVDVVQLGLGGDGHTASLVPDDPVLDVTDRDVAVTVPYQGRRRMTLTFPAINRARHLVWMVGDAGKAAAVRGLVTGDPTLPASHVRRGALMFLDAGAARG